MKRRFFSALLCAALLVSLAACGGTSTPPDASAQASFAGEWISYASYKNQKAVPYEYFVWSVLYTLNADGSYTAQSTDGSADVTGKWTGGKDGGAVLKRDGRTWTLALLEGSDGVAELREKGSTAASRLVARTDSALSAAPRKSSARPRSPRRTQTACAPSSLGARSLRRAGRASSMRTRFSGSTAATRTR